MSRRSDDRRPWPHRRWVWAIGLAMLAQVALVWVLSDRSPLRLRNSDQGMATHQLDPVRSHPTLVALQSLNDPTLFALPGGHGFAGTGWALAADPAPPVPEWDEPLCWLAGSTQALLAALDGRLAPAARTPGASSSKPPPRLGRVAVPPLPLATQSHVRVEGDLARRGLRSPMAVPSLVHSNLLTNTVVRLCVRADGEPWSAVVLQSSGLRSADAEALILATSARFQPEPGPRAEPGGLTGCWGELIFRWHVVAAPPGGAPAR